MFKNYDIQMTCKEDYCENSVNPFIQYQWLTELQQTWYECQIFKVRIAAHDSNSKILTTESTLSPCLPRDLYCTLKQSTIIWDQSLVQICPYKFVKLINLDLFGSVLVSDLENQMFQITGETTICGNISVFNTAEGFQLTTNSRARELETANIDVKIIDGLLLAEIDFNKRQQLELIINIYQTSNLKFCLLYKSILNIFSKLDDEFFKLSDFNGNEAILYSDESRIFIPQCQSIDSLELINSTTNCYKDIPVKISIQNKSINAFLTQDKIIRLASKLTNCKNNKINILLSDNQLLIKEGNIIFIHKEQPFTSLEMNLQTFNVSKINFMTNHDSIILNSINMLNETFSLTAKNEITGILHVIDDHTTENTNIINQLFIRLADINSNVSQFIHNIILYIILLTTIIITTFICIAACKRPQY